MLVTLAARQQAAEPSPAPHLTAGKETVIKCSLEITCRAACRLATHTAQLLRRYL